MAKAAVAGLLAWMLAACASLTPPPTPTLPQGQQFSGRLSVQVQNNARRSFSATFELTGTDKEGVLSLSTPLGTQLARAVWSPQRVELQTPERARTYASLDDLATEALGDSVPIAGLFDWLAGRPWPAAPSRPLPTGFEQLGWLVAVARLVDGALVAARTQLTPVVVWVRLDRS